VAGEDPTEDAASPYDLACAVRDRGVVLARLGRYEDALAAFDEVVARFGGTPDRAVAGEVVGALGDKSAALRRLGRDDEAAHAADETVAAYDRVAARHGDPGAQARTAVTAALMNKAGALWDGGRNPRLVEVYDALLARVASAPEPEPSGAVLEALLSYAGVLTNLNLGELADTLPDMAAALFGDAGEPEPDEAGEPSDAELAALLAATYRSDCWEWFAAPDADRPCEDLADRAVDLLRRTAPVIDGDEELDLEAPRTAAAFLIRSIADGYALLTRPGPVGPQAQARLPVRSQADAGIRMLALDRWAADHGAPLGPVETDDEADPFPLTRELDGSVAGFPLAFVKAVRVYDVYATARRSPFAPELLRSQRDRAADAVSRAIDWVAWLAGHRPDAAPAAVALLLCAQASFVAAWSPAPRDEWFPDRALVADAVDESDVREWCEEAGVALPGWLG
jgi:hypothetical protein